MARWWQLKYFSFSSRNLGDMIQFDEHIFQMGWFNHQLDIQTTIFCVQNLSFQGSLAGSSTDPWVWRYSSRKCYCWLFIRGYILLKLTWKNSSTFDCDIAEFLATGSHPQKKGQEQVPKRCRLYARWWFHVFFWDVSLQFLLVAKFFDVLNNQSLKNSFGKV